jgi:tetratricopeptide (TPR) repeat protein
VISLIHPFLCFILIFLLSNPTICKAEEPDPELIQAYQWVLRMELDSARGRLSQLEMSHSNTPFFHYVYNLADALEIFITEDPILYEQYEEKADRRIEILQGLRSDHPMRLFSLGEIRLQTSMLNAKFGEELSSVWNLRKAYFDLTENKRKFPDFTYTYKSLGLLHIMLGTVPKKYHWILSLLNMEGTVEQGKNELEVLIGKDHILGYEASLIQLLLQTYIFAEGETAIKNLEHLSSLHSQDILFNYIRASVMLKNSRAADAESLLKSIPDELIQKKGFHLYHYLKGEIGLMKGDYANAIQHYNRFLDQFKGQNFIKDVYYKLSLCYFLKGSENKSTEYRSETQKRGRTIIQADKYAAKMVNREVHYQNQTILKIRLATDGGYYSEAKKLIRSVGNIDQFDSPELKVEYTYRKARVMHKSGSLQEAVPLYKTTINECPEGLYFGANSALQLGYIYLQYHKPDLARTYFEKALSYKRHEYKVSIDNKALAALRKLDDKT